MTSYIARGDWKGGAVRRRPRFIYAAVLPVAIPLLLAAVRIDPADQPSPNAAGTVTPRLRYSEIYSPSPAELPEHSVILTVESGDTLDSVLTCGGLSRGESAAVSNQMAQSLDLRRLRPGNLVRFHYDRQQRIDALQLKVAGWGEVDAVRSPSGEFTVTPRPAEEREIETTISATIDTSLYDALVSIGEGPQLAQQLVDIYQWDIDFFELEKGDSFSLVVKKRFAGPDQIGYGPVLASRFNHAGLALEAFRQEMPDGRAGYYSRAGAPLRKQFLRAPLSFTRITSGFSRNRFHPILHSFRAHRGVDYGAPVGTPVKTTADGVVIEARRKSGEGNFVRIRHTSRIETYYLHLSRFAKGIERGKRVMQGDVIGYVGMTGLATGPHLDYRVNDNGTWLDPLKLKSITPDPLRGPVLNQFRASVARLTPQLSAPSNQIASVAAKQRALF